MRVGANWATEAESPAAESCLRAEKTSGAGPAWAARRREARFAGAVVVGGAAGRGAVERARMRKARMRRG